MAGTKRHTEMTAAVNDSVTHGYRALELVFDGLGQSVRQRRVSSYPRTAAFRAEMAGGTAPAPVAARGMRPGLIEELGSLTSELLLGASEVAQDIVRGIQRPPATGAPAAADPTAAASPPVVEVPFTGAPGETATVRVPLVNPSNMAMTKITLAVTDLVGAGSAPLRATLDPTHIKLINPQQGYPIDVSVEIPAGTKPGIYRGLMSEDQGGACKVLVLTVVS